MINFEKSELEPTQKIDFLGYHFDLIQGKVFPTGKKLKILEKAVQDMEVVSQTTPRLLMSLLGVLASLEKTIPMGRLHMRPFQWYLKTHWQYPQSPDLKIPVSNLLKSYLQCWKGPKNLRKGCPLHPQEHNTLIFTDASNQGSGAHLENLTISGNWTNQGKLLHINVLELKAVFLALKSFQNRILDKRVLIATDNATVVSYLNKQGGTHSWDMCLLVWCILAYCNPRNILIRARHIQGCLNVIADSLQERQNNSDRMVSSSSNIQSNLQSLAHTNGGHVCHQIESQATNLCLTSPRCKCYEHRCIELLLGGSGRLCLLSCSTHTKSHTENEHLQVQDDSSSTRVAQNALVWGSSESVNQAPLQLPHWPHRLNNRSVRSSIRISCI